MKQKLLLKTMLLLFALIAGSSSVWAAEQVYYTLATTTGGSNNSYAGNCDITVNGIIWNVTGNAQQTPWRIGGKQITTAADRTVYSKGSINQIITKTIFTFGSNSSTFGTQIIVNSVKLTISTAANGAGDVIDEVTKTSGFGKSQSLTFTPSAGKTWSKDSYYTFTFNITTDNNSSNRFFEFGQADFYYDAPASAVSAPTFDPASGAVTAGTTVTLTQAAADAIRYTTDGTNPTKTTGTLYDDPIEITTPTTIKAIAIKGENVSSVASASYTINVTAPTFNHEGGSYIQGTTISITSTGNTVYYTIKTDGSTPSNPTNASTEYTAPIALGVGTTKIKAIAYDTYGNASSVVTRTYTGLASTTLPFNWYGTSTAGKDELAANTGVVANLGSNYADSNAPYRLKFDGVGKSIIIYTDEKPEAVSFSAKLYNATSTASKMKVQGSEDGLDFTDIEEFTIEGAANATFQFKTTNAFAATYRAVKLVMSEKDQNVGVGSISVFSDDDIPVTISTATWASFSNASALDFTGTGVTAYIAKEKDASNVTLSEITKVPASTGIVVNAPAGTYAIPVLSGAADATTGNLLKPWLTAGTPTAETYYTLAVSGGNPIFKKSSGGTLAAGKAYLVMPTTSAPVLNINIGDGNTTGIDMVKGEGFKVNGEFYNLNGQRVAQPTKGLYIVNGKKVVIK